MDDLKRCSRCGEAKPRGAFYHNRSRSDGLEYECKACVAERNAAYRAANAEKLSETGRERSAAWRRDHPEQKREHCRRHRARKRAAVVEHFTDAEIFERDGWMCQACGEPVDPTTPRTEPLGAHIDHVIPLAHGGAHARYNVELLHAKCNLAKSAGLYDGALARALTRAQAR